MCNTSASQHLKTLLSSATVLTAIFQGDIVSLLSPKDLIKDPYENLRNCCIITYHMADVILDT